MNRFFFIMHFSLSTHSSQKCGRFSLFTRINCYIRESRKKKETKDGIQCQRKPQEYCFLLKENSPQCFIPMLIVRHPEIMCCGGQFLKTLKFIQVGQSEGPIIFSGTTSLSNSSLVSTPKFRAASCNRNFHQGIPKYLGFQVIILLKQNRFKRTNECNYVQINLNTNICLRNAHK